MDNSLPSSEPHTAAERLMERTIFASRWLLAPFYVGLAVSLQTVSLSAPHSPRPFIAKKINPTKNPPIQAGGMATTYFPVELPP